MYHTNVIGSFERINILNEYEDRNNKITIYYRKKIK